jgi:hypothetical protein
MPVGVLIASLLVGGVALAAASGPTVDWWVIAAGGGLDSATGVSLGGTAGQWVAGSDAADTTHLDSGFWGWVNAGHRAFLPLVLRQT